MKSMSVQTARVTASALEIRKGAGDIKSALETLEGQVGALRAAWSGEAQATYDVAQREWTKSLTEMQELLERIASSTEQISQDYGSSDQRNARRFTAV